MLYRVTLEKGKKLIFCEKGNILMEKISQKEFHSIKRLSKNYIGLTAEKTINVVSCNTGKG